MDPQAYPFAHLLGVDGLERPHIEAVLQRAARYADPDADRGAPLSGRTVINMFFEASTRTQASFDLAAKRLGAATMNMSPRTSSMSKGESLLDTAGALNAMQPDILIVRHQNAGAAKLLSEKVKCAVVNAGDGAHEHPTQALLDALTMRMAFAERRGAESDSAALRGLTIAICGDVRHSRVARSNIFLHRALGNRIRVVGPPTLLPVGLEELGVETFHQLSDGIAGADVVMMLRLQNERMDGAFVPSKREYFHRYGLDAHELRVAVDDVVVMHPGPINRGVEIDSGLVDDERYSVISRQIELGVVVRMAVLELLAANLPHAPTQLERLPGEGPARRFETSLAAAARPPERWLIKGGRLVNPDPADPFDRIGDLIVEGDAIADLGPGLAPEGPFDGKLIDAAGLVVAPGIVDLNVMVGEPGERHKESFGTAGEAAISGGVTTLAAEPDATPPIDDPALLDFIAQRIADERASHPMPDIRAMAALTKGLRGEELAEYALLTEKGAVALSNGRRPVVDAEILRRALDYAAAFDALVAHQPYDPALARGACAQETPFAAKLGLPAAPAEAETTCLQRDLALVALTGARYHMIDVATAGSIDLLRDAKARGLDVTAAVSAARLSFSEDDIRDYRTFFRLEPPLGPRETREALVQAVAEGVIDVVASGHTPLSGDEKRLPYEQALAGAVGLETLAPAVLALVAEGRMSLVTAFQRLSYAPARRIARGPDDRLARAGALTRGAPADLALLEPERRWRLDRRWLRSKAKNSPYDLEALTGFVRHTIVAGRLLMSATAPDVDRASLDATFVGADGAST